MEVISAWELYLWTRLDGISNIFAFMSFMSTLLLIICAAWCGAFYLMYKDWESSIGEDKHSRGYRNSHRVAMKVLKPLVIFCAVMSFFSLTIPTQKEAAVIYVVPRLANSEQLQEEANEIYTIAKEALKEMLPSQAGEK